MRTIQIGCTSYEIEADLYEASDDEVLLVLPGYLSSKARYADFISALVEESGFSALVVDYTGHGESPFDIKDISPAQNFLEVITAFDWLKEQRPNSKITVIGTSYGGFHATQLTKYREFERLILRVPAIYPPDAFYTKWKDLDREAIWQYRAETSDLHAHPLLKRASRYTGSTLVITHELDEACPKQSTDAFTKAFNAESWDAKGFKHGFAESNTSDEQLQEYRNVITGWLAKH